MSYNFLNYDGTLLPASNCEHDSNIAYTADFSIDGEVNGWEYYDGIHTYGCWNNFLFGTLYDTYAVIGRYEPILPIEAEDFYTVKIVMKLNLAERVGSQEYPKHGRLEWRTLSNPLWGFDKLFDFELYSDDEWHTYTLNMGEVQWWQGDINDLRIWPILSDGRADDEFYIRSIEVTSVNKYRCLNYGCSYWTQYEHDCPGIGERGFCKGKDLDLLVREGTRFEFAGDIIYTIEEGVNDTLLVSINEYGFENVVINPQENIPGKRLANEIAKEISKLDVGGYAECEVEYTAQGAIKIYSGVYVDDSTVRVGDTALARELNFFDRDGNDISEDHVGRDPATGFRPFSSFRIKTHQIYSLLDSNDKTEFFFNPFIYSVEGGRRDWLDTGLGEPSKDIRGSESDTLGLMNRHYDFIDNDGKTLIDFNHPFNASGRITNIYAGLTLDMIGGNHDDRGAYDSKRKEVQLSGAKIMFFRPLKNGDLRVLPMEVEIADRDYDDGALYAAVQEYVELECDLFVNKGDLIGVYNANIYRSRSISGAEIDALYYQIDGKASGDLQVRQPTGQGSSGLLLYARGNQQQNRLVLDLDLGKRINVKNIHVVGDPIDERLEYNVARCLDINWDIDLFGEDFTDGYVYRYRPLIKHFYNHPNLFYGKDCLTDGIKTAPDGLAAESFQAKYGTYYTSHASAIGKKNGGQGMVLTNAKYFGVNGDCEWLAVFYHVNRPSPFSVGDFERDPIEFTLTFPHGKEKLMHKSKIFFKERFNMRSFSISHYRGPHYVNGTSDDVRYDYIPVRTDGTETPWVQISLDGLAYRPEDTERWKDIDIYLAKNPTIGHSIEVVTGVQEMTFDEDMAYWDELGGLNYYATGKIINNDQYIQATHTDWTILEHEWEPLRTQGFRFYNDYHASTKICEFEVFCVVENIKSSMGGSVGIEYSAYAEDWWAGQNFTEDYGVRTFIGDTPQYARITVSPITEIKLSDVSVEVSFEDVFMGEKGCQHMFLPENVKGDEVSKPQQIDFKNVYGRSYDLYISIAPDPIVDEGVVFYSILNNEDSITDPVVGPDAYYRKHEDFRIENYNKNVAINCPVYALKNLLDGADAWYSYDREYSWRYWGKINEGNSLNFSNLPNAAITTINMPVLTRSKWWKIGFFDPRLVMTVREVQVYYDGEEIFGINFYHHKNQDAVQGGNTDTAPHLQNRIVDGSYYVVKGDNYIGIELPDVGKIDQIILYHDFKNYYENSHNIAGIDIATSLCIHGQGGHLQTDSIVDESYYEHAVQVVGSGIYCDEQSSDVYYDFTEDFSDCVDYTETFDGPDIDTSVWTDLVGAWIENGELHITNSGIIGEVTTVDYYLNDFDVTLELEIDGAYDNGGWGCYLEARTDDDYMFKLGRTFYTSTGNQTFESHEQDSAGGRNVKRTNSSATENILLRMHRDGITTTAQASVNGGNYVDLGSSVALSVDPVRFRITSELSPLANDITIGRYDNFLVDNSAADWGENTDYSSSFTCTSGLPTSTSGGWGYVYDVGTADYSHAAGYKRPRINEYRVDPLDQDYNFVFKFMFQGESFLNYQGNPTNDAGISVGLISHHVQWYTGYYRWRNYFTGAQVVLRKDNIGIALQNTYCQSATSYVSLNTLAQPYYCTFSGSGDGLYTATVWTDDWEGSNQVAKATLNSSLTWEADKVGVGSGYSTWNRNQYMARSKGWVSDFDFICHKNVPHQKIGTAIRFSGYPDEQILVDYDNSPVCNIVREGFDLDTKRFTIDFHVMFETLPEDNWEVAWLIGSWHPDQALSGSIFTATPSSWILYLRRVDGTYYLRLDVNNGGSVYRMINWNWYPDLFRWYHIMFTRGCSSNPQDYWILLRDGHRVQGSNGKGQNVRWSGADVIIGKNFTGWMDEIRVSADYDLGGGRVSTYNAYYQNLHKTVPTNRYERYYTASVYDSSDNIYYGKNMDVDVVFDNTYSYHEPHSTWSETYYTFFAIDFGQRHYVDLVRSFPINTSYQFTKTSNVLYSDKDTADPLEAFSLSDEETDLSTDFTYQDHDYPHNFTKQDTTRSTSYIIDNTFYQMANPNAGQEYARADFNPYLKGDFDVQIDFDLGVDSPDTNVWQLRLQFVDINNSNNMVRVERSFQDGTDQYAMWVRDNSSSWSKVALTYSTDLRGTLRLVRDGQTFKAYKKTPGQQDFYIIAFFQIRGEFNLETQLRLYTLSDTPGYPRIENWWDNFIVNAGEPIYSTYQDARWVRIKMLNGDGTTRTVQRAGFYPDITVQANQVGQYNCTWEPLGPAVTSYAADDNIALGATVSGSSYVGEMEFEHLTDGIIIEGDFESVWGSSNESSPWVTIHLPYETEIYRVVIYHGYDNADTYNLVTDYKVQVSTDNEVFTTIFNISGNNKFSRTHDLAYPVTAKQVRIAITDYNAINRFIWTGAEEGFQFWKGAVMREVEVYKYYGFTVVNSEDNPIINVDLNQAYFVEGHSLVGVDAENSEIDWSNADSNFTYANSHLADPHKFSFRPWGSSPGYDKWVAVKRNTATSYPKVPTLALPYTDTPDFLKHVVIHASADDVGTKPNPIMYPWMWRTSVSTLSYDYDNLAPNLSVSRNLKIEYPAGESQAEHLYFIEGDTFGEDTVCSWRDGFGFYLYIDNVDNLDTDYGYLYLGGFDYTRDRNPVVHRWNWSTISGALTSGWNNIALTFLYADEIIYTELNDPNAGRDPRRLWTIDWGRMGMIFKTKNNQAITMNWDGIWIERNHFEHGCFQDYGLYLHANDVLKCQIGEMSFHSGAIEFFIRPDWDWSGRDIYGEFKYRSIFHFANVDNDMLGAIMGPNGIEVYYGNLLKDLNVFGITGMNIPLLDNVTHMAYVFSNDGTGIASDRSTIRVYINNVLLAKETRTWKVSDDKHFNFLFGGQGVLAQKTGSFDPASSAVDGVLSRLRVHNYCKLDYSDSLEDSPRLDQHSLIKPSSFIEISQDNVTYHKVGSEKLPFFYEDVPHGTTVPVWVKLSVPKDLTGSEDRTARVLGNWDIGV